jgi:phosphatidylserine/phosphatidylglycerophosphate/cardiolipin synthase-like enzyme
MTGEVLISPRATARLVVTMPPAPSRLAEALAADIASDYVTLTPTTDAFRHLALSARQRFTIMIPYIDRIGTDWAAELFETTQAIERVLVIRDALQISGCGEAGRRLERSTTRIIDYRGGDLTQETFHAKIVLADGVAAYVGSANLLRRSKLANLECGILVEGPAVHAIKILIDAVVNMAAGFAAGPDT